MNLELLKIKNENDKKINEYIKLLEEKVKIISNNEKDIDQLIQALKMTKLKYEKLINSIQNSITYSMILEEHKDYFLADFSEKDSKKMENKFQNAIFKRNNNNQNNNQVNNSENKYRHPESKFNAQKFCKLEIENQKLRELAYRLSKANKDFTMSLEQNEHELLNKKEKISSLEQDNAILTSNIQII